MKKLIIVFTLFISVFGYSQAAGKLGDPQNVPIPGVNPQFVISADPLPSGTFKKYIFADIRLGTNQITGLETLIQNRGNTLWYPLTLNPSGYLTSFTELDPNVPSYAKTLTTFNIIKSNTDPLYYPMSSNPSGYMTTAPSQINTDWNSISGISQLLNKPNLSTVGISGLYSDLLFKPTIYSFTGLSTQYTKGDGTYTVFPTNVSYFTNDNNYTTMSVMTSALTLKENTIVSGLISQYYAGDKSWKTLNTDVVTESTNLYFTQARSRTSISAGTGINYNSSTGVIINSSPDQTVSLTGTGNTTIIGTYPNFTITTPVPKRQETYSGTTNASGVYTVNYGTAYSAIPNVQFQITGGTNKTTILLTSSTTTTCSFLVQARADVLGLLPTYSNVNGAIIEVLVTQK